MDEGKYTYEFADGEISEINISEIPPEVLTFLDENDRFIRRNNNRETRRHLHWEQMENGHESVPVPQSAETEPEKYHREILERLEEAIEDLLPDQKELVKKVYFKRIPQKDIADCEGVSRAAVTRRLNRIRKKIEKNMSETVNF